MSFTSAFHFAPFARRAAASLVFAGALGATPLTAVAATGPVPVVIGETPVEVCITLSVAGMSSFSNPLYTVPAGKMLIVDSATLLSNSVSAGPAMTAILINRDASNNIVSLTTVQAPAGAPTTATQALHQHVLSGQVFVANVFTTSGNISGFLSFSGRLVDAP